MEMEKDDRRNGPILTKVESTQIFGNIEEIYHLHLSIAEQLDRAINDDECIGAVFLANVRFARGREQTNHRFDPLVDRTAARLSTLHEIL